MRKRRKPPAMMMKISKIDLLKGVESVKERLLVSHAKSRSPHHGRR
jgi:hypothetical protein